MIAHADRRRGRLIDPDQQVIAVAGEAQPLPGDAVLEEHRIVAATGVVDHIAARVRVDQIGVVASAAQQGIVARPTTERVVAAPSVERVATAVARQVVAQRVAGPVDVGTSGQEQVFQIR